MKLSAKIFGQALPAPTFFVKLAQRFNAGEVEPENAEPMKFRLNLKVHPQSGINARTRSQERKRLERLWV